MANLFLDTRALLEKNDSLNYINYDEIREEHKEFLRSDLWDLEVIEAAHAVYFPGNQMLKVRTTGVSPSFGGGLTEIEATIRQFRIRQTVISSTTSGTISVTYIDREDQAIRIFLDDWREKLWGRENRYTYRKEDTIATWRLTHFNSSRKPIAKFLMYAIQPSSGIDETINKSFDSGDPQNIGEYNITYSFEHYSLEWCNIPS